MKNQRKETNQTVHFKLENTMFLCQDAKRYFRQLPINALDKEIFLQMEKNGWKVVCVYKEHNGDEKFNPVRALGRR